MEAPVELAAMLEINTSRTEVTNDVFGPVYPPDTHQQQSLSGFETPEIEPLASRSPSISLDDTRALALSLLEKPLSTTRRWPYGRIPRYLPEGPAELAASNHICPNEGQFPSVIIPLDRALEGISQEQVLGVTPEEFLILVFFLGGKAHFSAHQDIIPMSQAKLREILQDDALTILAADHSKSSHAPSSKYSPPISHFLTGFKPNTRNFLLNLKTIGISETIAFHVLFLTDEAISWIVGVYKTSLMDGNAAPTQIRSAIMRSTFDDTAFRKIIASARSLNIPLDIFTAEVLTTISVHPLNGYEDDHRGKPFIVGLAPFTETPSIFEEAKRHIRKLTFWHGAFKITPIGSSAQGLERGEPVICGLCKMDNHHSFACPFNTMPGWWGPKLPPKENTDTPHGTSNRSRGERGSRGGGSQGNRSRGSRGQGFYSRRGRY